MECNQYAIVWARTGQDRYGEPTRDGGTEIRARWEWKKSSGMDAQANKVLLDAQVVVDRDIPLYSIMFEGRLTDFIGTGSGDPGQDLVEVLTIDIVPDINGREYRRTLGVKKFRGTLPEVY